MPQREVVYLPSASADFINLYFYIAERSGLPDSAARIVDDLTSKCDALSVNSERYRVQDDIVPGLRFMPVRRKATIAYRIVGDTVQIVRVFYAGQNVAGALRAMYSTEEDPRQ